MTTEAPECCVTPLPLAGDWFVLHTRSRQEKALADNLQSQGIGVFLPILEHVRYYGRRKVATELPMFPGYVFLRGQRDDAFVADRTKRVVQIISVADQGKIDWELRNIHLALSQMAPLDPYPSLCEGVLVEVRSGPFRGLQGIVDHRNKPNRIVLQVQMLARAMALEVDASLLEVIG